MTDQLGLKSDDLFVITQTIAAIPGITKAVVFGSRAKGNYKNGSDIDLAVWATDNDKVLQLSGMLNDETLLPYKFDVLNYETIHSIELKEHIDRVGVDIYPVH